MYEIYCITNKINGKKYVGKTKRGVHRRWMEHAAPWSLSLGTVLSKAIDKYGKEQFNVEKIDTAETTEEANDKETLWIVALRTYIEWGCGYNLTLGGDGGCDNPEIKAKISATLTGRKGHPSTPETNLKISLANKGRKRDFSCTVRSIQAYIYAHTGRKLDYIIGLQACPKEKKPISEETRRKMSESAKHRPPISEETRRKLSLRFVGRPLSPQTIKKMKETKKGKKPWPKVYEARRARLEKNRLIKKYAEAIRIMAEEAIS